MLRRILSWLVGVALGVGATQIARADPLGAGPNPGGPSLWSRLELEFPVLKPLRFSFDGQAVPGFEPLRLPTFRSESVWFESGRLSLRSFTQVAPSLELDCSVTCQPMLDHTLGVEGRLQLGGVGPAIPATYLYVRGQSTQVFPTAPAARGAQKFGLLSAGFGGLLDF